MSEDIVQGSPEWIAARLGRVTASRISDVIAKTKTGYGSSRANYMADLVAERLTGVQAASYSNAAMQWGTETEPLARVAYEFRNDVTVREVGFIPHPTIQMAGASPDGYVGDDGLVEIKCPSIATHIDTLLGQKVPDKYIVQMQWQMACTGRQWCDYVSFDPRLVPSMSLFVARIKRDDARIAELEKLIIEFLGEVAQCIESLTKIYGGAAVISEAA